MKSLLRNSLWCLIGICISVACTEKNTVYHSYLSVPNEGWSKSDTLFFQITLNDPPPTHLDLFAEVRNLNKYPYQNLYLFVSQNMQNRTIWKTDTLEIKLTDPKGKWKENTWGSLHQSLSPIRTIVTPRPGKYTIKVVHGMKDLQLLGLNDVGIRIEK